jgi:hypothetical protein
MRRSLSLRYLAFNALPIPKMRGFYPRPESAPFFVRHNVGDCLKKGDEWHTSGLD